MNLALLVLLLKMGKLSQIINEKKMKSKKKEKKKRTNVMINEYRIKKLKKIGGGNLSRGIRIACDCFNSD